MALTLHPWPDMIKAAGIFVGLVIGLGFAFAMIGDGLGKRLGEGVATDGSARRHQVMVPKETLEQRRLRHMSYFDERLYRRSFGQAY